jgi:YD repeat-containing protein
MTQPTKPPGAPGPVTGPNSVLEGSSYSYTVTAASGATSYAWSLSPTNAGTVSGTSTTAIVHWGKVAGTAYLICASQNNIGSNQQSALNVTVTQPVTTLVSGTISPALQNSNVSLTTITSTATSGGNGVYSYQWQSSSGNGTWANINGGWNTSYTPPQTSSSTYYRLITTSGSASVTSNTAFVNTMLSGSYSPTNNIVSVNKLTGTANVVIPLYTLKAAGVDFPINLTYSATGVKGTDMEGNAGMGWNVSLGGAVTRQLRGLPDDATKDNTGVAALGWLYENNSVNIGTMSFANDNNTSSCNDESSDISLLNATFPGNADSEPDIFQVNAPGLSCQLVFDQAGQIHISPYQDLKISYTTGTTGATDQGQIESFTITNDQGITYAFSATSTTTQIATTTLSSVNYFQSNYNHYKNGITYYSSWGLTSIQDIHGNGMTIGYIPAPSSTFQNLIDLSTGGALANLNVLYTMIGTTTSQNVGSVNCKTSILGEGQDFQITYNPTPNSNQQVINNITGMGHDFIFGYNNVTSTNISGDFTRVFLNSITDDVCSAQNVNGQTVAMSSYAPLNLTFNYLHTGSTLNTTSSLATPNCNNMDYWGYTNSATSNTSLLPSIDINPSTSGYERYRNKQISPSPSAVYTYSITGANREADQDCTIGTLSQINYPAGGYTALSYAPNDYYDNTAQATIEGGGVRVTQVLDHDAINTDNDFIKTYTYRDASGNSTGKALSLPVFAFTIPYSGTNTLAALWTSSTMVSPVDLSGEDHSILYTAVTETINNTGSTVYQYTVPATNWDSSAPVSPTWSPAGLPAWNPTIVDVGRAPGTGGSCQSIGVLKNDVNTYPFPPNVNYDFERGLPTSISKYNNTGTEVSETDYSYQTPETPFDIAAVKYDMNNYATNYAKYTIHTAAGPLVTQITNKVFDLTNVSPGSQPVATAVQIVTTNNTYNTVQHKLSQQVVHNSEGSSTTTNIKYLKDYGLTTSGDSYTNALLALQNDNLNIPVETYTQFTPVNSSTALTTHADLVLFGTFPNQGIAQLAVTSNPPLLYVTGITMNPGPAPLQHLTFNSVSGVTDFSPSSITNITSFQHDSRYVVTENDLGYDYAGALLSSNDGFNRVKTNLFDNLNAFRLRATINNASYDQIGMDLPEITRVSMVLGSAVFPNAYNFTTAGNGSVSSSSATRNGEQALTLPANGPLTKVLNKNPQAQNYIFSIWINSSSGGSFTVSLTDGTNSSSKSFTFDATTGNSKYPTGFEYCQVSIPVRSLSPNGSSPLTLNFSSPTAINFTDIMTYPDVANVVSYSYDNNQNQISSTDGNGVSTYYSYDALGRATYVYDQDNNIIERKTYVNTNPAINSIPTINLSWTNPVGLIFNQDDITFQTTITGNNTCTFNGSTIYTWDFGDGQKSIQKNTDRALYGGTNSNEHTYSGKNGQQFICTLTITSSQNSFAPISKSTVVTLHTEAP